MDLILQASIARAEARFQSDLGRNIVCLAQHLMEAIPKVTIDDENEKEYSPQSTGLSPSPSQDRSPQVPVCSPLVCIDWRRRLLSHEHEINEYQAENDLLPSADATAFVLWASNISPFEGQMSTVVAGVPVPQSLNQCSQHLQEAVFKTFIQTVLEDRIYCHLRR